MYALVLNFSQIYILIQMDDSDRKVQLKCI